MSNLPDDTNGAVSECAEAELGDVRRPQRLVELAHVLAPPPPAALPAACGDGAMLTAASRFFDNDAIAPQDVLLRHSEATYSRLSAVPLVVTAQETTAVDWTAHPATQGLGPLGHTAGQGRLVHSTLAFPPARRPLGRLAPQVWARDPDDVGQRARRQQRPISQQASQTPWRRHRWSHSVFCRGRVGARRPPGKPRWRGGFVA
jgi:Transposase DNA-binding